MNMADPLQNQTGSFAVDQNKMVLLNRQLKGRENKQELQKAANQFEGVFVKQMLDAMDKTVDRSGFMDGGSAEEMFRGMLNDKISEALASRPGGSGLGIGEAIYRQMESQLPDSRKSSEVSP
jgi:peptidoglycan hydrolase FlgJ